MRKTKYLLEAIVEAGKKVVYYAVDLSESSLSEGLKPLIEMFPSIEFVGLWGTYHDSLNWISSNISHSTKKLFLW
jgi:L-histidine Nalpha-methyltransferase / hercynylcysteine S-oxide synthase